MERFNGNVSAAQIPLEQAPEVLKPICVNLATDVGFGVIHEFMHVVVC